MPQYIQRLLSKFNINEEEWLYGVKEFGQYFGCAMGPQQALEQYGARLNKSWLQGVKASQRFYRAA